MMTDKANDRVLMPMTAEAREHYLAAGCDPACHICGEKISVGDWYGMQTFVAEEELFTITHGVMRANITGTACAPCIRAKKAWPEEERKKMMARLSRVLPPPAKPSEPKPKPEPRPVHRGCFFVNGEPF